MSSQTHRTCIRMGAREYEILKQKSHDAGGSANAWLMRQLERNRPVRFRTEETREAIDFVNQTGRQITRNPRAKELDADAARKLNFLMDQICEQAYRISCQE